ncbi:Cupredoxin [Podospora didyma]|uniref:Cupredoxin n=1 Tax=Podospora didyma TaxID=330526 RepID=A0AAE0TZZ0_9PEZI|nr:Cupredoxin [Podospora didyma]
MRSLAWAVLALLPALVSAVASTDEYTDADPPQSGYLPNHNIDPNALGSYIAQWRYTGNVNEMFHAKPLTWTPPGGSHEYVIYVSNQNIVRVFDGLTGAIVTQRTLRPYFTAADAQCGDIPNMIGITGTPTIDPATDIMYLYSKGYKGDATGGGTINGEYKLYALRLPSLQDVAGFPVSLEGHNADNDKARYFVGGTVLQRPGLVQAGNQIIAGFGGHCDNFNYTGMLVAVSKTSGVGVTAMRAMMAAPGAPSPQALNIQDQGGGKAGIWQSGMAISFDSFTSRLYLATGNGRGEGDNGNGVPASGKVPISALANAVANFGINTGTGAISPQDYFEAYNYENLNGGDNDLGSCGVALLDPATFSGGGVSRIAVAAGKGATVYILNADDLGGFANGPGGTDNVLQQFSFGTNKFFGGVGSYPLEGGYIYFTPGSDALYAYKFGIVGGKPVFTQAGKSAMTFAGNGVPTVTTLNGRAGTGIVWLADVNQGLVAYKAVPEGGVLVPITLGVATGRLQKFQRPVFGNARVYSSGSNKLICVAGGTPPPLPSSSSTSSTSTKPTSTSTSSTSTKPSSTSSTTSSTSSTTTTSSSKSSSSSSSTKSSTSSSSSSSTKTSTSTTSSSSTKSSSSSSSTKSSSSSSSSSSKSSSSSSSTKSSSSSPTTKTSSSSSSTSSSSTKPTSTSTSSSTKSSSSSSTTKPTSTSSSTKSSSSSSTTKPTSTSSSTKSSSSSSSTKSTSSSSSTKSSSSSSSSSTKLSTSSSSTKSSSSSTTFKTLTTSSTKVTTSASATPTVKVPKPILRTFDWDIGWVRAAPDGFARPFVGINGQWPCPPLVANLGDEIKIRVTNSLGNESTAIHFHGLFQENTTYSDGPAMVTQCPIQPGGYFVYQFVINQPGTYWYHAHIGGQYIDGLRGALIVKDVRAPYGIPDQEFAVTLSDLYHKEAPFLVHEYLSAENSDATGGAEPVPDSNLINDAQNVKFNISPGKTYLFRIINVGAVAGQYLEFDQHDMTIVEVDGVYTQPSTVKQLFIGVAQRYSVLVKAKTTTTQNFAIVALMNSKMFDATMIQPGMLTTGGWLVYDSSKPLPAFFNLESRIQPWDDSKLVPHDVEPVLKSPAATIYLTTSFGTNSWGSTRAMFNGVTYLAQKVPTLYTAMTAPKDVVADPLIYGQNSNTFILPFNAVVEVNINNHDNRAHPFHLHGHNFQIVARGDGGANFPGLFSEPATPIKRDVIIVYADSSATIRFVANNPGINLFHCHTEWHVESGLTATFVEAPEELQARDLYIPVSHRSVCDAQGIKRKGNAGGNAKNWRDLSGAVTESDPNYWGALVAPPA